MFAWAPYPRGSPLSLLQVLWGGGIFAEGYLQEHGRVRGFLHLRSSAHGAQVDVSLDPEEVAGAEVLVGVKEDQAQCWSREPGRGECGGLGTEALWSIHPRGILIRAFLPPPLPGQ